MATTFDISDVPAADAGDLAAAMRALIETGHGLVLFNGASETDLDTARAAMQSRHHAEPQRALPAFIRFRSLIDVFGARRLKQLMLDRGHALLAPALALAATQRLNARRGFNPQQFLLALNVALAENVVDIDSYRGTSERRVEHLRAA